MAAGRGRSLRARLRTTVLSLVVGALLLLGLPLAVVLGRLLDSQAVAGLQREATRALAVVPDDALTARSLAGSSPAASGVADGVYRLDGSRAAGAGPDRSSLARLVADGREHHGTDGPDLAVVIPVVSDGVVVGAVRAAEPRGLLDGQVARARLLLALLGLAVALVATVVAERAVRALAGPFEALTLAAGRIAAGQEELDLPRWGVREADAAAAALTDSARTISGLLRYERDFVRHASHQLRTPLSGVLLGLEQDPPDVAAALRRARDLDTTITDLLALRAPQPAQRCSAVEAAGQAVERWTSTERRVELRADDVPDVALSEPALRQALDVLVHNALRHGAGPVVLTVEPYGDRVVLEVADDGPGLRPGWRPGTGLQLATGLVERAGGSLWVRQERPRPRLAMLLPTAPSQGQREQVS